MAPLPAGFTLLQITPRLDGGGVERLTLDVAGAVSRAGGRSLIASRGGRLEAMLTGAGELVRLPVDAKDPLTLAANAARLAGLIRRENVSVAHVRSRAPAFSALLAARATGRPLVATYHGIYAARSGLKRWYNAIMTRGDAVIANSRFTESHILAEHRVDAAKVVVIPEGVDTAVFDPAAVSAQRVAAMREAWGLAPGPGRPILLLAARLTGWKGQRLMVEALGRLADHGEAVLVLAGRAEKAGDVAAIEAAVAVAGLADRVRLVGALDDMPAAYAIADLVVAPSTAAESFGRGVVEAGAMGRPVIASRLGAHAETVVDGETGWLAAPGDADAWTAAVRVALAASAADRRVMGAAARARVTRLYSLEAMCAATFDLYSRLVEARR